MNHETLADSRRPQRTTIRERAAHALASVAALGLLGALAFASPCAFAQVDAYTTMPVDVYAGPSGDYPVVTELDQGVPVTVMGCVSDYSWCDVAVSDVRGWVYGGYLEYPYQGSYVPLEGYGAAIGLPIVGFSIGAYWDNFYRGRPWYHDRDRWAHIPSPGYGVRPPPPRRPPGAAFGGGPGHPPAPAVGGAHPSAPGGGGVPHPPANGMSPGGVARPPMGPQERGGIHPPMAPQERGGIRPPGPPAGYGHVGPPMAPGGARPPGPPAGHAPEGGHPSGDSGGHGDAHPPN